MKIKLLGVSHLFSSDITRKFEAISNINLDINQNEFIGIIGPTGSGKTTLIEHLNGLLLPSLGSIEYEYDFEYKDKKTNQIKIEHNKRVLKKSRRKYKFMNEIKKQIGIVFQFAEYQLFEETIEKDIIFGPINLGIPKEEAKEIAKEMIVKVGLDESYLSRSPFELSGGQKRRIAIAGILAIKPDVLVFDEPTAGLDPDGCVEIMDLFEKLNQEGKTIIIVTHNLDDVLKYANRTIFIKEGKIIKDNKTINVLSDEKFLIENKMAVPKMISLVNKMNKKYNTNFPYINSIENFVEFVNNVRKELAKK